MVKRITVLVLLLLLAAPLSLMAAQVSAVADRDRLGEGESLQLELRVQGSPDDDPDLSILDPDWEILSRSQSSQMQIVNGDFSRSVVYKLTLMPRRSGELQIPAVCFGSDCSVPQLIHVSKEAVATRSEAPLLLEVEAAPQGATVGSQVLLTVRVLHRVDLAQASLSEPQPEGVEAEMQRLGEDRSFETRRDGVLYQTIERRYALFPQKAGTLRIPGLQLDAQVSSGYSRFDPFGRSLQTVRRRSEPIEIRVEPIPADRGGPDWLPARSISLRDDWQGKKMRLTVGEPATRTLTLRASGLPAAHLPELKMEVPEGFKSYPDQPARSDQTDGDGITGTLQQKLALVATRSGRFRLPAIELDWWDTERQRWQKAQIAAVDLEVAPASGVPASAPPPAPPPFAKAGEEAQPSSPSPPPAPAAAQAPMPTPAGGIWPWVSLALALGWFLNLVVLWWRGSRPVPQPAPSVGKETRGNSEKEARRAILRAARSHDPRATRQALVDWSSILWPESIVADLEELGRRCGAPIDREITRLNEVLYGARAKTWQGGALAAALEDWRQPPTAPGTELPPLYPGSRQGRWG